jgi:hypothetical protein
MNEFFLSPGGFYPEESSVMTYRIDQKALENPGSAGAALLDFFVNSMFVTVRAELFQFHP